MLTHEQLTHFSQRGWAVQEGVFDDAFIDYMLVNQHGGNWDWPHNNWYATHHDVEGGKWYFHMVL